jgi:hypothetical protein
MARSSKDYAIAWIYNRDGLEASDAQEKSITPATGSIKLSGLQKGKYRATWWDAHAGRILDSSDVELANNKDEVTLSTPPLTRDVALYINKAGAEKAKVAKSKGNKRVKNSQVQGSGAGAVISPTAGAPQPTNSGSAIIRPQ